MVDGSKASIENIALTKLLVDIAHSVDVSVEGELELSGKQGSYCHR